jgi:hypothetical protein
MDIVGAIDAFEIVGGPENQTLSAQAATCMGLVL